MTRGGDGAWRIAGSRAYLEDRGGTLRITYPDGTEERRRSDASYEGFCADALARLREGREPLATVRDCARAARLLERIYAAAPPGNA
jgi:predicted dehydrogenase